MYPETDIPPIIISKNELEHAQENIPKSWDESIEELQSKYEINLQLAEQLFDSKYLELFENIIGNTNVNPTFVASILCSTITNLERSGLNSNLLKNEEIKKSFEFLGQENIAKESIEIIFENIMAGKSNTVEEAMKLTLIETVKENDLEKIIQEIVDQNEQLVKNQRERSIGPLMGIALKELRGKASGEIVNKLLLKNIQKKL